MNHKHLPNLYPNIRGWNVPHLLMAVHRPLFCRISSVFFCRWWCHVSFISCRIVISGSPSTASSCMLPRAAWLRSKYHIHSKKNLISGMTDERLLYQWQLRHDLGMSWHFVLCMWALQTKKNALECLSRLLDSLDKMVILEEVLPFLTEIQCSDVDIIMAVVGQ